MKHVLLCISYLLFCVNIVSQSVINKIQGLELIKNALEEVSTAEYSYSDYFLFPGQLTPDDGDVNRIFIREQINVTDTIIGARFFHFNIKRKDELLFAYDGDMKVKLNWDRQIYNMFDYRGEPWNKRALMAPFFTRSLAIVNYALHPDNEVVLEISTEGSALKYLITILNKEIEFVGKISDDISKESSDNSSVYELWVDSNTFLPFKISRTLSSNTIVEEIAEVRINQQKQDQFIIVNYLPNDFSLQIKHSNSSVNLLQSKAANIEFFKGENSYSDLYQFGGEVIVLQFTSHFCGPCINSRATLDTLQKKYLNRNVKFIAIYNCKEDKCLENKSYTNVYDFQTVTVKPDAFRAFNIQLLPTFIILNKYKMISNIIPGYTLIETENIIDKAVQQLLKESESKVVSR
ncbi:TlpA family protein disulfide reductase [Carboxylicivirga sp. RSCT41]|uniref:TlpA family protein disulfide reductase n=1 Tax=Carboxylicivirga agarovorans TaxID=3417570 RepID=UPI003D34B478